MGKYRNRGFSYPRAISSLVKLSRSPPSSCKYMHSGFVQGKLRRKKEQYLVVPNDALRTLPSTTAPSTAWIAVSASSLRA